MGKKGHMYQVKTHINPVRGLHIKGDINSTRTQGIHLTSEATDHPVQTFNLLSVNMFIYMYCNIMKASLTSVEYRNTGVSHNEYCTFIFNPEPSK